MKVRDVMTHDVVCVDPETPLREVAAILAEHRISGVPVTIDGACVGIVSEADLLPKQLGRAPKRRSPIEWIVGERMDPEELRRRVATTARNAMSAPPITTDEEMTLREAAQLMIARDVNRLPVVREGRLVGIVSRADLVRAYLRQDEDIAHALRENLLRLTMWLDPDAFSIEVRDGSVVMSGIVDRRSTAGIIGRLAGLVEGVVEVQNDIGWELDDTGLPETAEGEHESGAASIVPREPLAPLHR
jgi:CBS domain-containing protein